VRVWAFFSITCWALRLSWARSRSSRRARGGDDHRQRGVALDRAQLLEEGEAVHHRHHQVEDDHVGRRDVEDARARRGRARPPSEVAALASSVRRISSRRRRVVLDDEHARVGAVWRAQRLDQVRGSIGLIR
jgi:hypothetical protein